MSQGLTKPISIVSLKTISMCDVYMSIKMHCFKMHLLKIMMY